MTKFSLSSVRVPVRQRWLVAFCVGVLVAAFAPASEANVFFTFTSSRVTCLVCDVHIDQRADENLGNPVETLNGAIWVAAPNGTTYAGGLKGGDTVRLHLELGTYNREVGTTHFLLIFTAVVDGGKPGILHVRDTSPRSKGEIRLIAMPAQYTGTETGLIEQVYRTPGADFTLTPTGEDGSGVSNDPLPWDHAINNPVIDFAITMSGLGAGAHWGISTIIAGAHAMPCHCTPGAPQVLTEGCSQFANDANSCCVPLNANDVQVGTATLYCPSPSDPATKNACGEPQPSAWTCPGYWNDVTTVPLDFSCTSVGEPGSIGTFTCATAGAPEFGVPASSCSYQAKVCP